MKTFIAVCLVLVSVSLVVGEDKYTTKYDNINLEEILSNERLFKNYYKCVMERGPCTPDGKELKDAIPDALADECSKCSEKQKEGTRMVIKHLINHKPEEWEELKDKYDPEGNYQNVYKNYYDNLQDQSS